MRRKLLVLWDPENPIVPVGPVLEALRAVPGLEVVERTFRDIGHQTLPNLAFDLRWPASAQDPDGLLWIEGGPLPKDLERLGCRKSCWLVNTHLEPTLLDELGRSFDRIYSASLRDTATEEATWLPLSPDTSGRVSAPDGISLLMGDPKPPFHAEVDQRLRGAVVQFRGIHSPVVICLGQGGSIHPRLLDALQSGASVLCDSESDLRGIAHVGDHLETFPSIDDLQALLQELGRDEDRLRKLRLRGPAIVEHLHQPSFRAEEIIQGFWPQHRVLSGEKSTPRISVLVTCHRYLKRFKVCLDSLAAQHLPDGALEVVVADPGSPDGLASYLKDFAARQKRLRVVHLPLSPRYHRNRGVGINRAFGVSSGQVVVGIDGDIVFPPTLIGELEKQVLGDPRHVYGVRRCFVGRQDTEAILRGELDPTAQFETLSQSGGDGEESPFVGVLGYCQAVHRSAFARARYPEEFDMINQSDIVFVERLGREAGVQPRFLENLAALHLWHPRNWAGTQDFL